MNKLQWKYVLGFILLKWQNSIILNQLPGNRGLTQSNDTGRMEIYSHWVQGQYRGNTCSKVTDWIRLGIGITESTVIYNYMLSSRTRLEGRLFFLLEGSGVSGYLTYTPLSLFFLSFFLSFLDSDPKKLHNFLRLWRKIIWFCEWT